jgi:hypothetical protein
MIPSILWSGDKTKGWALETLIIMRSKIDCSKGQEITLRIAGVHR